MAADLFEKLSGGQFIDLGSRLSAAEIIQLGLITKRACPDCGGEGIAGMLLGLTEEAMMIMMPLLCDRCKGEGEVFYICYN